MKQVNESYQSLLNLDDSQYELYYSILSRITELSSCKKHKKILHDCLCDFHKLFLSFRKVDTYINLDNYHDFFDKNKGDMRLSCLIQPSRNMTFSGKRGMQFYITCIEYIASMMLKSGYDFNDHNVQKNYCLQCDYFLLRHNRNYTFDSYYKFKQIDLSLVHAVVLSIIAGINNKTFNAVNLKTDICPCFSSKKKIRITYKSRKQQLVSTKFMYTKYVHKFDDYLKVLYVPSARLSKSIIKAEKKSYLYYNHKYNNVIHQRLTIDSSKSIAQQVKNMITVKKSDKDYYNLKFRK